MANAIEIVQIEVNGNKRFQVIDWFGVNINSKYWANGKLSPVMDRLISDLGATLYRVDIFGKSNWVDPGNEKDASVLNETTYTQIYQGEVAKNGWGMMRYLNQHGIEPYLTCSGDVPNWMLGSDGKTLVQYDQFCDMLASLVDWARNKERLKFKYFGPLNETDIGSPEGPAVQPAQYARILEILDDKLHQRGIDDLQFVVAEQGNYNTKYIDEFIRHPGLAKRIGAIGLHAYANISSDQHQEIVELVKNSLLKDCRIWLSEYGDLEQSGEKEWYVAWVMTMRLMAALAGGFTGAMAWDAYDNYHDHNEAWTIYGLIRTGLHTYTPKTRYYASRQFYRYILPGFERIEVNCASNDIKMLGFSSADRSQFTLVGVNNSHKELYINAKFIGFDSGVEQGKTNYIRTSENEQCVQLNKINVRGASYPFDGLEAKIPPYSIFTLTTIE